MTFVQGHLVLHFKPEGAVSIEVTFHVEFLSMGRRKYKKKLIQNFQDNIRLRIRIVLLVTHPNDNHTTKITKGKFSNTIFGKEDKRVLTGSAVITHNVTTGTGYCLVGFSWIIDFLN